MFPAGARISGEGGMFLNSTRQTGRMSRPLRYSIRRGVAEGPLHPSRNCARVFTSYNEDEGDAKIPYLFFDVYHQNFHFCISIMLFIFAFGFGISFLFDYLNKKFEKIIFPCESLEDIRESIKDK